MLDRLEKHHLGVVVEPAQVPELETRWGKAFHTDATQGVRVCFRRDDEMGLMVEYFTREGRAARYPTGFHHICYTVPSLQHLEEIHAFLTEKKLGFRLTFPERSGSVEECGMVCFYQIRHVGMVEFNIPLAQESPPP